VGSAGNRNGGLTVWNRHTGNWLVITANFSHAIADALVAVRYAPVPVEGPLTPRGGLLVLGSLMSDAIANWHRGCSQVVLVPNPERVFVGGSAHCNVPR
jgi:hypothetical protein